MRARVKYIGQSAYESDDRYAEITTYAENANKVANILSDSGYNYDIFDDDDEAIFMVYVDDMNDYKKFMSYWKEAKRTA